MLRADALKFTVTFRAQIPKADVLAAFPGIVALLGSESNVVHSQAAMCIDQLLVMKVWKKSTSGQAREADDAGMSHWSRLFHERPVHWHGHLAGSASSIAAL